MKDKLLEFLHKYDQIILLVSLVFIFRVVYVDVYDIVSPQVDITIATCLTQYFSNIIALAVSIFLSTTLTHYTATITPYGKYPIRHILILMLIVVATSLAGTFIIQFLPLSYEVNTGELSPVKYALYRTVGLLPINLLLCVLIDLMFYFLHYNQHLASMETQKHKAQYLYSQLKQQLNPHFLFNTLNILDYLVQNGDTERASQFIRKLASIYRYLLNTGSSQLVSINEELKFVNNYYDLLKERFLDGIEMTTDIPEQVLTKQVIPCALQILIENATKHNVANSQHPLHIKIYVDEDFLVITNNIQPKINTIPSTGIGLKNISLQYRDIVDKDIKIIKTDDEFQVRLPIIK